MCTRLRRVSKEAIKHSDSQFEELIEQVADSQRERQRRQGTGEWAEHEANTCEPGRLPRTQFSLQQKEKEMEKEEQEQLQRLEQHSRALECGSNYEKLPAAQFGSRAQLSDS